MIGRLLDKLIFGGLLIVALQVPQLADHYRQFLAGLYESTQWQVQGYEATARRHDYADLQAMIDHHLTNPTPSVRSDAEQKLSTLELRDELVAGLAVFEGGNLLDKSIYMLHPQRVGYLEKTLGNFTPGLPLSVDGLVFGAVLAVFLNFLLVGPVVFVARRRRGRLGRDQIA